MVKLGLANSRMKDVYDLVILSRMFEFYGGLLVRAIRATFQCRATSVPSGLSVTLTAEFTAFIRKSGAPSIGNLQTVASELTAFIAPRLNAAAGSATFGARWEPGGPWK